MCAGCKYCQFEECTYEMTEEEAEEIENENDCPFYVPYWAKEKNPYVEDN